MRAKNAAKFVGDWSTPEVIDIADIPPPKILPPHQVKMTLMRDTDGHLILQFEMNVTWLYPGESAPTNPSDSSNVVRWKSDVVRQSFMTTSRLEIAIGLEPIENPYFDASSPDYFSREVTVSVCLEICEK